ncbi:MAG TPA: DUF1800 domain-containing protein [Chthoniobacteraceae bacterium]|nr:DUF1800 domain-containing protein [Chthoniobacteraceae bacterium]
MSTLFSPLPDSQFDAYKAAHLLWRAGFGGTWDEAAALAKMGLPAAVAALVNYPNTSAPKPECAALPEDDKTFQARVKALSEADRKTAQEARKKAESDSINELKFWWLGRMLETSADSAGKAPAPLQEKMTLFWHSHFASSFAEKIEHTFPMWQQNEMFRENALIPFPDLLKKVIRDPAMLVWLDNAQSRKEHANENLAREFMELFSMGVGNYTENDVKAAARCLTGYSVDRETWTYQFHPDAHDTTAKTYLGQTGNFDGDDMVRIICAQDATARFMTKKFLTYFVYDNPEKELIDEAAALYRSQNYDTKQFLTTLFQSQLFYSQKATDSIVKSPVVLTIGALKAMRVKMPEKKALTDSLRLMGQDLFFPPEVNGWVGGTAWINSNMLLIRYNFANYLLNGVSPEDFKMFDQKQTSGLLRRQFVESQRSPDAIEWSPRKQLKDSGDDKLLFSAAKIADYYARQFLQRQISKDLLDKLQGYVEVDAAGGHRDMTLDDANFDEKIKGLVHLIMSSPDYQLC